jgi:DNA-directed RNA polymerase specialized sigma24 family protein
MDLSRQLAWPAAADRADEGLLVELERREGQALFGFVRRLGLNDSEAQDVVQEVFLRLWRQLGTGRPMVNGKGWAYQTGYRLAMDQHRLRRRAGALVARLGGGGGGGRDEDDRIAVWAEVDRLPARQREILYLRYRSDLTFEIIGEVLGITSSAARSHATQAMATLRQRFPTEGAS